MKTLVLVVGWTVGFVATVALGAWLLGMVFFVMGDKEVAYPGLVAYIPKWVFAFSPLILLGLTKRMGGVFNKFVG